MYSQYHSQHNPIFLHYSKMNTDFISGFIRNVQCNEEIDFFLPYACTKSSLSPTKLPLKIYRIILSITHPITHTFHFFSAEIKITKQPKKIEQKHVGIEHRCHDSKQTIYPTLPRQIVEFSE